LSRYARQNAAGANSGVLSLTPVEKTPRRRFELAETVGLASLGRCDSSAQISTAFSSALLQKNAEEEI